MFQISAGRLLVGSIIAAFIGVTTALVAPLNTEPVADMYLKPNSGTLAVGSTLEISILIESTVPTNVFGGTILFNNDILVVESINYNTSVADLWAVEPWYENGSGTIGFAGGTTHKEGFTGTDTLLTVTFKSIREGDGILSLDNARIIKHDGLGIDATLEAPIDAIFTVAPEVLAGNTLVQKEKSEGSIRVVTKLPTTDLNDDGEHSFADVSIFLVHLASQNNRSDFNLDGKVNTTDLSIILNSSE